MTTQRLPSMVRALCVLGASVWFTGPTLGDMIFGNYQPARHDRFYETAPVDGTPAAFIGLAANNSDGVDLDFSGVGRVANGGVGRWATMITPTHFLSATHYHPSVSDTVAFFHSNNASGVPTTRTVMGGQAIAGTDLWLGTLDSAVPSSVQIYPVAETPISSGEFGGSGYDFEMGYSLGLSPNSYGPHDSDLTRVAVGSNALNSYGTLPFEGSTGDVIGFANLESSGTLLLGDDETLVQPGDSGAPTFILLDGELTLVGVHWLIYRYELTEANALVISMDTFVPNYVPDIVGSLSSGDYSLDLVAVPEPHALLPLAGLLAFWVIRRRVGGSGRDG